jgi:hypothetical protein
MALIDPAEFQRGRALAVAEWERRGDGATARAFGRLELAACGFGMDQRSRTCWATIDGLKIGLAFDLESGAYERSFVIRARGARRSS